MATVARPVTEWSCALLRNVSWDQYESFLEWLGDRPGVKVNYDAGRMEIMAPMYRHDREKSISGRLVERLCEEIDIPSIGAGSVTLKRQLAEKGIEPDECYWLEHETEMRGKRELDLEFDPPPDLAIEIENTTSILDRLPIYAGIGIPEIWRWHDDAFQVLLLGADGQYHRSASSLSFPNLHIPTFTRFVQRVYDVDELSLVKEFVAWVRDGMPPLA